MPRAKEEPQSQVKCEPPPEVKVESSSSTREVKAEHEESEDTRGRAPTPVKQEEHPRESDSEDPLTPTRMIEAVHRMLSAQEAPALETSRGQDYGPYAPQGGRRARGRYDSPDPFLLQYYYLPRA